MRKKLPDDKKKDKITLSIDEKLSNLLDEYLKDKDISNKSRYIENLIYQDMEEKGKKINREF